MDNKKYYKSNRAYTSLQGLPSFINKTTDSTFYKLINIPNIELDTIRYDMKEGRDNVIPTSSNLGLPPCIWEIEVPYGELTTSTAEEVNLNNFTFGTITSIDTPSVWLTNEYLDFSIYCDIHYLSPMYYEDTDGSILSVSEGYVGLTETSSWFDQQIDYFIIDSENKIDILQSKELPVHSQNLASAEEDEWITLSPEWKYTIDKSAVIDVSLIDVSTQTTLTEGLHYNFISLDNKTFEVYNPYRDHQLIVEYSYAPAPRLYALTHEYDSHSISMNNIASTYLALYNAQSNRSVTVLPGPTPLFVDPNNPSIPYTTGSPDEEPQISSVDYGGRYEDLLLIKESFVHSTEEISGSILLEKWTTADIDEDTMFYLKDHNYEGNTYPIYYKYLNFNTWEGSFNRRENATNLNNYNLTLKKAYLYPRGAENWNYNWYHWYGADPASQYQANRMDIKVVDSPANNQILTDDYFDQAAIYGRIITTLGGDNRVVMIMTGSYAYSHVCVQYNKKLLISPLGSLTNYTTIASNELTTTDEFETIDGVECNYLTLKVTHEDSSANNPQVDGDRPGYGSRDYGDSQSQLHSCRFLSADLFTGPDLTPAHRSLAYYPYDKHIEEDDFAEVIYSLNSLMPGDDGYDSTSTGAYLELYNRRNRVVVNRISLDNENNPYQYPTCIRRYQDYIFVLYRTTNSSIDGSPDSYSVKRINVHDLVQEDVMNFTAEIWQVTPGTYNFEEYSTGDDLHADVFGWSRWWNTTGGDGSDDFAEGTVTVEDDDPYIPNADGDIPDFNFGEDIISNGTFLLDDNSDGLADDWGTSTTAVTPTIPDGQRITYLGTASGYKYRLHQTGVFESEKYHIIKFDIKGNGSPVTSGIKLKQGIGGTRKNFEQIPVTENFVTHELVVLSGNNSPNPDGYGTELNFAGGHYSGPWVAGDFMEVRNVSVKVANIGTKYLKYNIIQGGNGHSDAQLYSKETSLIQGKKYRTTFTARVTAGTHVIDTNVIKFGTPYNTYLEEGNQNETLTTDYQTFTRIVTANITVDDARMQFSLGGADGVEIHFDNIRIERIDYTIDSFAFDNEHNFLLFGSNKIYKANSNFNYGYRYINLNPEDINAPTEFVWYREEGDIPIEYTDTAIKKITEQSPDHWGRVLGADRWDKESLKEYNNRLTNIASSRPDTNKQGAINGISALLNLDPYKVDPASVYDISTPLSRHDERIMSTVIDMDGEGWKEVINLPTVYNDLGIDLLDNNGYVFDDADWTVSNNTTLSSDSSEVLIDTINILNENILLLYNTTLYSGIDMGTSTYLELTFTISNYKSGAIFLANHPGADGIKMYNRTPNITENGTYTYTIFTGNGHQQNQFAAEDRRIIVQVGDGTAITKLSLSKLSIREVTNPYKFLAGSSNLKITDFITRDELEPIAFTLENATGPAASHFTSITINQDTVDSTLPTYTSRPYLVHYKPPIYNISLDNKNYEHGVTPMLFFDDTWSTGLEDTYGYGRNYLRNDFTPTPEAMFNYQNVDKFILETKFKPLPKEELTSGLHVLAGHWYESPGINLGGGLLLGYSMSTTDTLSFKVLMVNKDINLDILLFEAVLDPITITTDLTQRYSIIRAEVIWDESAINGVGDFQLSIYSDCDGSLEEGGVCSTSKTIFGTTTINIGMTGARGIIGGIDKNNIGARSSEASIANVKAYSKSGDSWILDQQWHSQTALEDTECATFCWTEYVLDAVPTTDPDTDGTWVATSSLPNFDQGSMYAIRKHTYNEYTFRINSFTYSIDEENGMFNLQEPGVTRYDDDTNYEIVSNNHSLTLQYYSKQNDDPLNPVQNQFLLTTDSFNWSAEDTIIDADQLEIIDIMEEVEKTGNIPEQYKPYVTDLSQYLNFKWDSFRWDQYKWQDGENIKTGLPTYYDGISERGGVCTDPVYLTETDCVYADEAWASDPERKFTSGNGANSLHYIENPDSDYLRLSTGNFYYQDKKYYLYPDIPIYELIQGANDGGQALNGIPTTTGPISARITVDQLLATDDNTSYNSITGGCWMTSGFNNTNYGSVWYGINRISNGNMETSGGDTFPNTWGDGGTGFVTSIRNGTASSPSTPEGIDGYYSYNFTFTDPDAELSSSEITLIEDNIYKLSVWYKKTNFSGQMYINDTSEIGPDIVEDGNFLNNAAENDDNGYWETQGLGLTIAGAAAVFVEVGGSGNRNLIQTYSEGFNEGKIYVVQFNITNWSQGNIIPHITGNSTGSFQEDGIKTLMILATAANDDITFVAEEAFVGNIEWVNVKEMAVNISPTIDDERMQDLSGEWVNATYYHLTDRTTSSASLKFTADTGDSIEIADVYLRNLTTGEDLQITFEDETSCEGHGYCYYDPDVEEFGDHGTLDGFTEAECNTFQTDHSLYNAQWVAYTWGNGSAIDEAPEGPLLKEIYNGYNKRLKLLRPISDIRNHNYTGTNETLLELYNTYDGLDEEIANDSVLSQIDSWKHTFNIKDGENYPIVSSLIEEEFDLLYSNSAETYADTDLLLNNHIDAHNKLLVIGEVGISISKINLLADRAYFTDDDNFLTIHVHLLDNDNAGVKEQEIELTADPEETGEDIAPEALPSLITDSTGEVTALIDISKYSSNLTITVKASLGALIVSDDLTITYIED